MAKIKRDLTTAQEKFLLGWYLTGDSSCFSAKTLDKLLEKGYLKENEKDLIVTEKGKRYCDKYHMEIKL